jgi:hypothetical protein
MPAGDHLGKYAEGWTMGSLADSYQLDDPNAGTINKQGFADYLAGMSKSSKGYGARPMTRYWISLRS